MRIYLPDFQEGVKTDVQQDYDPKKLDLEFVDLEYSQPLALEATVEKNKDSLTFKGRLHTEVERTCGRCLKKVKGSINQPFELYYETKDKEEIETTDDLREALILDHPISFICQNDCKGLCPQCGVNLNSEKCNCDSAKETSTFSGLKKFWDEKERNLNNGTS